jgi:hypothetical protein
VLKKPGKENYQEPGAWRPIALPNTIGKAIEKAFARRLRDMAETKKMLPESQIGGQRRRGTKSALKLLTKQIHIVWGTEQNVVTLLSLNILGAFDTVDPIRLQNTLKVRGVPLWMVR